MDSGSFFSRARAEVYRSAGGLSGRADPKKDMHLRWRELMPLHVGDGVEIRVLEAKKAAKIRRRAARNRSRRQKSCAVSNSPGVAERREIQKTGRWALAVGRCGFNGNES